MGAPDKSTKDTGSPSQKTENGGPQKKRQKRHIKEGDPSFKD